jgi:hypothetical protein
MCNKIQLSFSIALLIVYRLEINRKFAGFDELRPWRFRSGVSLAILILVGKPPHENERLAREGMVNW